MITIMGDWGCWHMGAMDVNKGSKRVGVGAGYVCEGGGTGGDMLHVLVYVPPQYFASQLIETYVATSSLFSVSRLPVSCLIRPRPFHHPINNVIKNSGNICTKTQLILNFLLVSQTEIIIFIIFLCNIPFFSVRVCECVRMCVCKCAREENEHSKC